jgi:hypothetical protein
MLYSIANKQMETIPHGNNYKKWRKNLNDNQYVEIMAEFERILNEKDIFNSSYLPGRVWNYPFEYIYEACDENQEEAALFYGLLCWEAVMKSNVRWYFKEKDIDDKVFGTTYWRFEEDKLKQ